MAAAAAAFRSSLYIRRRSQFPIPPDRSSPSSSKALLLVQSSLPINGIACRQPFPSHSSSWEHRAAAPPKAVSANGGFSLPENGADGERYYGFLERLAMGISQLPSILPGGSWWKLPDWEGKGDARGRTVTAFFVLRQIWELVANDRWVVFVGFASLFLAAASEISIPHFLAASVFSAQRNQTATFLRNSRTLILLCVTSGICSYGSYFGEPSPKSGMSLATDSSIDTSQVKRMREKLYSSLLYQDISFFDAETVGDLTSRLGADCQQVSRVIGNDLNVIARSILQGTGALAFLLTLSWPLALSTLAICCVLAIIMFFYGQYQKKTAKLTQEYTARATDVAQETISLMRTVRVYGTEKQEFGRYTHWLNNLADLALRQSLAYGLWSSSFNALYHSTQVIAVVVGGAFIMSSQITAEQLTKFLLYCEWLIYALWWLGDNWSNLMQSIGASEKVFQLMDLLPSKQFLTKGLVLDELKGCIQFVKVSFYYPSRNQVPVLQNINLSIQPNDVIAIVGLSGSGKSTLVNLLLRLYEPTDGQILVDGHPITELDIKWLRERIGLVGQEPRLFRLDIESNLKYGCPREVSHRDVELAAKQAFAHDFICSFPNGYETLVDDDLLSGGQKQRLAIARALLRNPNILVLDEATSALDAESEQYIKEVLIGIRNGSMGKRTVIIIAHRLSTVQVADKIVVMEGGRIVEMGGHMQLLRLGGVYAQLTKKQTDGLMALQN